jgi:hypothetical protein
MNIWPQRQRRVNVYSTYIVKFRKLTVTYDHRLKKIGHPVRSAILKLQIGRLVVGWVTTSEYLLLYVFLNFFLGLIFFCGAGIFSKDGPGRRLSGNHHYTVTSFS